MNLIGEIVRGAVIVVGAFAFLTGLGQAPPYGATIVGSVLLVGAWLRGGLLDVVAAIGKRYKQ